MYLLNCYIFSQTNFTKAVVYELILIGIFFVNPTKNFWCNLSSFFIVNNVLLFNILIRICFILILPLQ